MTTKIAGATSSAVAVEPEDHEAPPAAQSSQPSPEANSLARWSSPAADEAYDDITFSFRGGWFPDMQSIDSDFAKLGGFDLLQTMKKLDAAERLEPIVNRMSPDERQALVNDAVKHGLLEREGKNGKLVARYELPASFQKMVDDLNGLSAREKRPPTYNWSSYREDPIDFSDRKASHAVAAMKSGDSMTVSASVGVYGATLAAGASQKVAVSRDADGSFRVSAEVGAEAGLHHHLHVGGRAEADVGVAGLVEYRFATADEAQAAVLAFRSSAAKAIEQYGRPTAFEVKDEATLDAMVFVGGEHLKLGKLSAGEEAQLAVRFEMSGDQPTVSLKLEGRLEGKAGAMLELGPLEAEAHALPAAEAGRRIEAEVKAPIKDPQAFAASPFAYLREHRAELMNDAELKATISSEQSLGHHGTVDELSITKRHGELEVERTRKHVTHERGGFDARVDVVHHAGFEVGYVTERRSVDREEVLYQRKVE